MTVDELGEIIEQLKELGNGKKVINIAYQPSYPLTTKLNHVYVEEEVIYLCESPYGGNEYAPHKVFEDEDGMIY